MNKIRVRKIVPSNRNIGMIFVNYFDETYQVDYINTFYEITDTGTLIQYAYEDKFYERIELKKG